MSATLTKLRRNYCYKCWYYLESKLADRQNHYKKYCPKAKTKIYPGQKACENFLSWREEYLRRQKPRSSASTKEVEK